MLQIVQHLVRAGVELALGAASLAPSAPPLVAYEELVANPESYLGQELRVHVQKRALAPAWEPYLTRFVPARFVALDAWSDAQLPWVRADYELPRVRVFVPRGGAAERTVTRAGVHRRLLVTCVVREHLAGRPWIEVVKVIPTRASIPEGSLLHAIRAEGFIERGSFALAAAELERALAAPLPAHAVASLEHRRRACEARAQKKRPAPAPEK